MRDDTFSILKTIHQHSVSVSLIEASRYLNNLSPEIINKTFYLRRTHRNLRSSNVFYSVKPRNKFYQMQLFTKQFKKLASEIKVGLAI